MFTSSRAGQRDQDVGVGDAGGFQHRGDTRRCPRTVRMSMRSCRSRSTSSLVSTTVTSLSGFAGQVIGRGAADLAGAEDRVIFHRTTSRFAYESISHFVPCARNLPARAPAGPGLRD